MENDKYILNIYPKAQADLDDIFRYISVELNNPTAAVSLINDMEHSLDLVCKAPSNVSAGRKLAYQRENSS